MNLDGGAESWCDFEDQWFSRNNFFSVFSATDIVNFLARRRLYLCQPNSRDAAEGGEINVSRREPDGATVPPPGRAVLQRASGTACWTHRSGVRTQLDWLPCAPALDSSTLARFFPRSPGPIKTLGLRRRLIYLQCHILALPETR
jgi:hypothetical protein